MWWVALALGQTIPQLDLTRPVAGVPMEVRLADEVELVVPAGKEVAHVGTCVVRDRKVVGCAALRAAPLKDVEVVWADGSTTRLEDDPTMAEVEVAYLADVAERVAVPLGGGELAAAKAPTGTADAWVHRGGRWHAAEVVEGQLRLSRADWSALSTGPFVVRWSAPTVGTVWTKVKPVKAASLPSATTADQACQAAWDLVEKAYVDSFERSADASFKRRMSPYIVCGTPSDWRVLTLNQPKDQAATVPPWLRPNRPLYVHLTYPGELMIRSPSPITHGVEGDVLDREVAARSADASGVASNWLAPRQPGPLILELSVVEQVDKKKEPRAIGSIELVTLRNYFGAVRFGLGASLAPAWREWVVDARDGTPRLQTANDRAQALPEFVVGFTPYLRPGGRVFEPNRSMLAGGLPVKRTQIWLAPYVGVGVVQPTAGLTGLPVSFLRSAHLGLELGLARYLGVAVTGVARTERVPRDGYGRGSPLAAGAEVADVTRVAPLPGVGVLLNVGPPLFDAINGRATMGVK